MSFSQPRRSARAASPPVVSRARSCSALTTRPNSCSPAIARRGKRVGERLGEERREQARLPSPGERAERGERLVADAALRAGRPRAGTPGRRRR
jgi:hypothetical protein